MTTALKDTRTTGAEPRTIRIRTFRSPRYELVEDLVVALEQEGDQVLACSYDTGQYGRGLTPENAIHNLCAVLEEYYELLQEDSARLSPRLATHLAYLASILRRRSS